VESFPGPNPIDPTLDRITILFRVLGWAWMLMLIVIGLSDDDISQTALAIVNISIATTWTGATLWAYREGSLMKTAWFVVVDAMTAFFVGGTAVGRPGGFELFHGGYPLSSVVVAANAGGLRWALPVSVVLAVEQLWLRFRLGLDGVSLVIIVVSPFVAIVTGWGFDALREHSARRLEAEAALAESEAEKARLEERADLAVRLHDSVLQTLHAIQLEAADPAQVTYLARRQERELKRTIAQFLSAYGRSFRVALMTARDEVEDMHNRITIDTVVKDDLPIDDQLTTVVNAAREAMLNAARHSGASVIDMYSECREGSVLVSVRDRGSGFEFSEATDGSGIARSIIDRIDSIGGQVDIVTAPGAGTEVTIEIAYPPI
jgi:signal transduction histidine kinase